MCIFADPNALDTTVTCNDNGTFTITLTATNSFGSASADGTLAVANVAPTVTINAPLDLAGLRHQYADRIQRVHHRSGCERHVDLHL